MGTFLLFPTHLSPPPFSWTRQITAPRGPRGSNQAPGGDKPPKNRQKTKNKAPYVAPHWRGGAIGCAKWAGVRVRDLLVDVTVRHPMADRYQPAAARDAGSAAASAAKEKREKCPSRGGSVRTTLSDSGSMALISSRVMWFSKPAGHESKPPFQ